MHLQSTSVREIPLTQGYVALVDAADYESLACHRWYYQKGYARRRLSKAESEDRREVYMHQVILPAPAGLEVDHRNGNRLDNRRANLRLATKSQQRRNHRPHNILRSSRFKGVKWRQDRQYWVATIDPVARQRVYLGSFRTEEDAARAYDAAARKWYGEFAWLNFPDEVEAP